MSNMKNSEQLSQVGVSGQGEGRFQFLCTSNDEKSSVRLVVKNPIFFGLSILKNSKFILLLWNLFKLKRKNVFTAINKQNIEPRIPNCRLGPFPRLIQNSLQLNTALRSFKTNITSPLLFYYFLNNQTDHILP